jgi:hypothetical protein
MTYGLPSDPEPHANFLAVDPFQGLPASPSQSVSGSSIGSSTLLELLEDSFSEDMLLELFPGVEPFAEPSSVETGDSQAICAESIAVAIKRAAVGRIIFLNMRVSSSLFRNIHYS